MKVVLFLLFVLVVLGIEEIYVWPYPKSYKDTSGGVSVQFDSINFQLYDVQSKKFIPIDDDTFMGPLVKRYGPFIESDFGLSTRRARLIRTTSYNVVFRVGDLTSRSLNLETNETYSSTIDQSGTTCTSENIFGALRCMETFAQLVTDKTITKLPITVDDSPRYQWRGLMVDVARHYLHIETLQKLVDAMESNKLNSLHLHLVDAQSFPLVIEKYPNLSDKGAYDSKNAIFTKDVLSSLKQYAYLRGVRIIPEIDVPGHAYSWGLGYPGSTAICQSFISNINNIPLDPTVALSHELLQGILDQLGETFDDDYFHFGGDEVVYNCWSEVSHIAEYMKNHSMDGKDLQGMFMNQAFTYTKKTPIVWQELAQAMPEKPEYQLPKDIIVEIWKNPEDAKTVISNGYEQIINSAGWYLDRQVPLAGALHYLMLDVWMDMWALEPENYVEPKDVGKIKGGESCMWAEQVNDFVAMQRIFPKACAVAERLWAQKSVNIDPYDIVELERRRSVELGLEDDQKKKDDGGITTTIDIVSDRLNYHVCHNMNLRGLGASPIRPNYCPYTM